jgi:hypothetical protein
VALNILLLNKPFLPKVAFTAHDKGELKQHFKSLVKVSKHPSSTV